MGGAKAKTINLLLYEGNLEGVISIEGSSWNSGELYSAPRNSVSELFKTDACKKYGVYMLISKSKVYIGQSSMLSKRIAQHIVGKNWWENVIILTTKDNSLTHSDIDYLESNLIQKAIDVGRLDCDNHNKGNNPKVSKFREVELNQYIEEALFLMELIGTTVFTDNKKGTLINTVDIKTKLALGKRAKVDAISFLYENGIHLGSKITYAMKSDSKNEFWANPRKRMLGEEWWIILNDNKAMKLIILKIPTHTLSVESGKNKGIKIRIDKPDLLDLNISTTTLKDRKSGISFKPFIFKTIEY